jgi:threonine dehydrogenase-like Zn-dependent dehydrogenase
MMKAAFFKLPGEVETREAPRPAPGPGEALVRVTACGVCGGDVAPFRTGRADWHRRGHEYAGEVVEVGEGVAGLAAGDTVAGIGSLPCGVCAGCVRGEPHRCHRPAWFGGDAFAEFVCKRAGFFFPIPGLSAEEGALMEPLTVAMDLVRDGEVGLGSKVLLMGAGPIGLKALRLCRAAGASTIYVSHPSTSAARGELAREWGADRVLHPDEEDVVARMKELEPDGVESVLVTTTPSRAIPEAAQVCAPGGTIAFIGMDWQPQVDIRMNIDAFHFRKLRLVGSNHNPCSRLYPEAAELLHRKVIDVPGLISHRVELARIDEAFEIATARRGEVRKILIVPS